MEFCTMSASYSKETLICNALWAYLKDKEYSILQFNSPGAQATLSITFTDCNTYIKKQYFKI